MLTWKHHLERLGDSRWARVGLGVAILVAGVMLGLSWRAANEVATDQAASVSAACDRSPAVARELAADGTCETAREVTTTPVIGPAGTAGAAGETGAQGAAGSPGKPGIGVQGVPGTPGVNGQSGATGRDGTNGAEGRIGAQGPAGIGVQGERGATGAPGTAGERGPIGPTGPAGQDGAPGPACPTGTDLQPVTFASGEQGLGCVNGGSGG